MKHRTAVLLAITLYLFASAAHAAPLSTGFTYQGRLTDNGTL